MPYVKLDCAILNSSLWYERVARELFITALLMAKPIELKEPTSQIAVRSLEATGWIVPPGWYGFVEAAGVGIVRAAGVDDMESGLAALESLGNPDKDSRTPDNEGRRMVRVDGGYVILNYFKYRDKDHTAATRSARYRERKLAKVTPSRRSVTQSPRSVTQATASSMKHDAEASAHDTDTPRRASAGEPVVVSAAGIQPAVEPPTSRAAPSEAPNPAETPGDTKKSRKPYVGAKNGAAHAHFISEWCAAYENDRGEKYKVTGGMDGKAVKELLAFDPDVDELIATAQAAWQKSGPKFWHCEKAVTITYFAARLNEIRAELAAPEPASTHRPSGQPQSTPVLMGREMKL